MNDQVQIESKVVITGQFECRDKDGVLLKTIDFQCEVPVPLTEATNNDAHADQRQ